MLYLGAARLLRLFATFAVRTVSHRMTWLLDRCLHVCKRVFKLGPGGVGNLPIAHGNFPLASAYRHRAEMHVA